MGVLLLRSAPFWDLSSKMTGALILRSFGLLFDPN